jgi:hypothetical protein
MMDKKLLSYVREQIARGVNINILRNDLVSRGWSLKEIQTVIKHIYSNSHKDNKKQYHAHHGAAMIMLVFIVMALLGVILIVALWPREEPVPRQVNIPITRQDLSQENSCVNIEDALEKDRCYQELFNQNYDCEIIKENDEKNFCYRSKENYLLGYV